MGNIFSLIITQPILNLTVFLYNTIGAHDLGVSIIVMTVIIRLILMPLSIRAARSQRAMAGLAPQLDAIKIKHKGDTAAQSEAIMALYKEKNINPLAGCLPLLIQLPILLGMYRVFINLFKKTDSLALLYHVVARPEVINTVFLGLFDISTPSHILAIAAGVLQFFQARMALSSQPQTPQTAALNQQMIYFLPLIIVVIGWSLPAGLSLYWCTTTLFSIGEQLYLRRQ